MSTTMITLLVAVLGFVAIAGVGFAFTGQDPSTVKAVKRAQSFAKARARDTTGMKTASLTPEQRRAQLLKALRDQERQAKKESVTISARMLQAGFADNPQAYWTISVVVGLVVAFGALVLKQSLIIALGAGFGGGFGLPRWVLGTLGDMRTKKFTAAFPDAMDIIVRGIKSGMPVQDCLRIIGNESAEPLGGEFKKMTESLAMGISVDQALEKMYARVPTQEVRFFAIVLAIQSKTGGNLAEALGNLSNVIRARKMMREKVNALSGEAVASAAIIGSLPPVVIILISLASPTYMQPMFHDPRGHMMLAIGAGVMAFGIFVMRKMINFKI